VKIIELTAENVKRLRAVDITPAAHVQVIAGRNAQGKTSVMDAIWLALGGGAAGKATTRPIRDGETTASVRLDLGDLIVTRTWTGDKTTLTVTSAEGARYGSPQKMLDDLVGRLSFDPLAFTHLAPREQRDTLLTLVDLPFDPAHLDRRRAGLYDERTEIGRQGKQLEGQLAGIPDVSADTPDVEVSSADLFAELRAAQRQHAEHAEVMGRAEAAQTQRERAEVDLANAQIMLDQAIRVETDAVDAVKALPVLPDMGALETRLDTVDQANEAVRAKAERTRVAEALKGARAAYDAKTAAIDALDQDKATGLAAAVFPIDGLGFDTDGVTYQGVPFTQASSAEQIRVSLAMAMAMNPKLRVIRILDGSLLDADNLALIGAMAVEHDYQVWVERVGDGDGIGVVIEDGAVVGAEAVAS